MRLPRVRFTGAIYHITTRSNNKEFLFQKDTDFQLFLDILYTAKDKYTVDIYAYCLTSNHYHILVQTKAKNNISEFMCYLNGNFAKAYNKVRGKTGHFWGSRFHSTIIESETQFFHTLFYIDAQMARSKVVQDPKDWKWSSYNAYAYGREDRIVTLPEQYLQLGATKESRQLRYRDMLREQLQKKGLLIRQEAFSKGIFLGSQEFVQGLAGSYGDQQPYAHCKTYMCWDRTYSLWKPNRDFN